jgi:ABC-type antimicrobial peptide transport system permease subunit
VTLTRLVRRSLSHYWQTSLLVMLGLIVASAVITGSLVIGDSMRGSLRESALRRLGGITHVLSCPGQFRGQLAADIGHSFDDDCVAALRTAGSAANAETEATVPDVVVWGLPQSTSFDPFGLKLTDRSVAINASLARDLGVTSGAPLILTVARPTAIRTDSLFGRRQRQDVTASLRVQVDQILPDNGPGDLRLDTQTARPRNVFISYEWLAEQLGRQGMANTMLVWPKDPRSRLDHGPILQRYLGTVAQLGDYGLRLKTNPTLRQVSLYSDGLTLDANTCGKASTTLQKISRAAGTSVWPSMIYLASSLRNERSGKTAAYAITAGIDGRQPGFSFTSLATPSLGDDEIWLNEWLAQDLGAEVGDWLALEYLVPQPDGSYPTKQLRLRVAGIVRQSGAAANADLMPDYPGLTDAQTLGDWRPPFPIDMSRITQRDELYWDRYQATPKAFVALRRAQQMWRQVSPGAASAYATSLQIDVPLGMDQKAFSDQFAQNFSRELRPEDFGLVFRPVREQALAASRGTSDFGGLFLGLSMFLVLAGAGLAGMLLRLSLERRVSQIGLMGATGISENLIRRSLLSEGLILTLLGTLIGVPAGIAYATLLIHLLTHWWQGALGATPAIWLHVTPLTLVVGLGSGLIVGLLTTHFSLRGLLRQPVLQLLSGWQARREVLATETQRTLRRLWAVLAAIVALVLTAVLGALLATVSAVAVFFVIGLLLLVAALVGMRIMLHQTLLPRGAMRRLWDLARRNLSANMGRSLLIIGLLAGATFVVVAVAANTRDLSRMDTHDLRSGTGGYSLVATSTVPLTYDLATAQGRENLGVAPEDETLLAQCQIVSLLASPGEDISCLNLARPQAPRLLGMPAAFADDITSGRRFRATLAPPSGDASALNCLGDADSVMWTLHSGLGKLYETSDSTGRALTLRIGGLIPKSIFGRELLLHEEAFRGLYPNITSPSYFLIQTPVGQELAVADALRRNLGELGLQVKSTGEVLAEFGQVQNTYLSMFLALGGLGLLLGTLGMVAVILRSVLERRRELALLTVTGFGERRIAHLLLLEHVSLLVAGLLTGTVAALIAVGPQLREAQAAVNWGALGGVLLGVLLLGLGACVVTVRMVTRGNQLAALRDE